MKASKGPSATTISLMIVGAYVAPVAATLASIAVAFVAIMSQ